MKQLMNHVLRDCHAYARAYVGDTVIFSQSWEEHLEHLGRRFQCLSDANLHVKLSKCQFGQLQVHYLGHVIGQGKLGPDENKIIAVKNYQTPVTKKDVRAFLGLVGYYHRFVPHFASIAAPLTNLTKRKPDKVTWDPNCENAFRKLKEALMQKPILSADPSHPFVLQTDISNQGWEQS